MMREVILFDYDAPDGMVFSGELPSLVSRDFRRPFAWTFSAMQRLGMAIQPAAPLDLALCHPGGYFRKLHKAKIRPTRRMELTTGSYSQVQR